MMWIVRLLHKNHLVVFSKLIRSSCLWMLVNKTSQLIGHGVTGKRGWRSQSPANTEKELILNRAGQFDLSEDMIATMTICPKHRSNLTVDWPGRKSTMLLSISQRSTQTGQGPTPCQFHSVERNLCLTQFHGIWHVACASWTTLTASVTAWKLFLKELKVVFASVETQNYYQRLYYCIETICYRQLRMARMEMDWNLKLKMANFVQVFKLCPEKKNAKQILWFALPAKFHLIPSL